MCGRPAPVALSEELLVEVYRHARHAFPAECCGWLLGPRHAPHVEGVRRCRNAQEDGEHPTAQERTAETAYVISGEDLLELSRSLDGPTPPRIIYHSHPNGRAYFSATDQAVATDPWGEGPMFPVDQLVVGIDAERVVEARLFGWDEGTRTFVELASFPGRDL